MCVCMSTLFTYFPSLWLCKPTRISATMFPPWVRVDSRTWINDVEACDCGGVIKALGAANIHTSVKTQPPTRFSPTGQYRFELNWTELLIMNVMAVYFFSCVSVSISISACQSLFYFFLTVHAHLYFNLWLYFITVFPLQSSSIPVFPSSYLNKTLGWTQLYLHSSTETG